MIIQPTRNVSMKMVRETSDKKMEEEVEEEEPVIEEAKNSTDSIEVKTQVASEPVFERLVEFSKSKELITKKGQVIRKFVLDNTNYMNHSIQRL